MWLRRPQRSAKDFGFVPVSGMADDPSVQAQMATNARAYADYVAAKKADASRQFKQGAITAVAVPVAAAGVGAMMGAGGGGAAAPASWSMPGVTAPSFGAPAAASGVATGVGGTSAPVVAAGASKLASMFTSPLASTVAGGLFSMGAQRSQNKAADQARRDTLAANAAALQLQREQLEAETRNADLDREDARALNAAINELKKRELDAAEEVRAFDREQALYLRSKDEATEARREPYRQAGQAALGRLMSMWNL